jgi:hypothetical protein
MQFLTRAEINDLASLARSIPYHVRWTAINSWEIEPAVKDQWFNKYYLMQWDGTWLKQKNSNGTITHDGVCYFIEFVTVPELCYQSKEVSLSFRRIFGQEKGYVLVKILGRNKGAY